MDRRRIAFVFVVLAYGACASDGAQRMPAGGGTIVDAPPSSGDPQATPDGGAPDAVNPTAGSGAGVRPVGTNFDPDPYIPQREPVPLDFDALGFTAADLLAVAAGTYRATFAEPIGEIEWVVPDKAEKVTLASTPTGRWLEVDVDSSATFAGTSVAGGVLDASEPSELDCATCATGTDYIYLQMYFDSSVLPTSFFDAQPQARGCPVAVLILTWRYRQVELRAFQILDRVPMYNGPQTNTCYSESAAVR